MDYHPYIAFVEKYLLRTPQSLLLITLKVFKMFNVLWTPHAHVPIYLHSEMVVFVNKGAELNELNSYRFKHD